MSSPKRILLAIDHAQHSGRPRDGGDGRHPDRLLRRARSTLRRVVGESLPRLAAGEEVLYPEAEKVLGHDLIEAAGPRHAQIRSLTERLNLLADGYQRHPAPFLRPQLQETLLRLQELVEDEAELQESVWNRLRSCLIAARLRELESAAAAAARRSMEETLLVAEVDPGNDIMVALRPPPPGWSPAIVISTADLGTGAPEASG